MKRLFKTIIVLTILALVGGIGIYLFFIPGKHRLIPTNPHSYATIGDIPAPRGYQRIVANNQSYANYLRQLPLKPRGAKMEYYAGGLARFQFLGYAVVDMPLLSNAEQCADVCMRLRAEYLYRTRQYGHIHFMDFNGHTMRYGGGANRNTFNKYLRKVYVSASTYTLCREMKKRKLKDIQPGDIFVYPSPMSGVMGHAVMVVDVVVNKEGRKAFLLAEGNTPARNIHVLTNTFHPLDCPWFFLNKEGTSFQTTVFKFDADDLRYF